MSLFLTLLPIYLFGNLHCLGMCGPLVAMIGHHRFRAWYFAGRLASFALAGFAAGLVGAVLGAVLAYYHVSALTSLLFGGVILMVSASALIGVRAPGLQTVSGMLAPFNQTISTLMLRDKRWPTFLFGLATVLLPCGQTIIVFSACAMEGDPLIGLANGAALALLTSPALVLAMHASQLLGRFRHHYNTLLGVAGILVGILALCRGMAELQLIPHLILNPQSAPAFHIVLY
ncbi:MAG: sulfite exporter TauE/SafE family protein [Chlamydiales bacterium]|nr:sulfite exporter TauE/SafE family protein [Chlamydiales bacterium]